jgi:hypothetical protein
MAVAQQKTDVLAEAPNESGRYAVFMTTGAVRDTHVRVILVVVSLVIEVGDVAIGFVIQDKPG